MAVGVVRLKRMFTGRRCKIWARADSGGWGRKERPPGLSIHFEFRATSPGAEEPWFLNAVIKWPEAD